MEHKVDHGLRLVTIFTWIPAFALLLAHGNITGRAMPATGIVPMTFSAIIGIVHIAGKATSRTGNCLMDFSRQAHQYQHVATEETQAFQHKKESSPTGRFVDEEEGRASISQDNIYDLQRLVRARVE
ncbi:hypothetical protein LTR08_007465 [Meristemomyces frigidus]|nr:hypothetical protein LTR08_007465 [Meristemomyces frigidus]